MTPAPAQSPANPSDHAVAIRKIATFDNDIQILGAQKNGHLLILEDVESRLADFTQLRKLVVDQIVGNFAF